MERPLAEGGTATFVLVHGGAHGPSCWRYLRQELDERGYPSVAPELPSEDPWATLADYAATVVGAMQEISARIVLVGHSLAGLTVPIVASQVPVDALVFLCAVPPELGGTFDIPARAGQPDAETEMMSDEVKSALRFDPDGSHIVDPALAASVFYNTCAPDIAAEAVGELRRQGNVSSSPSPLTAWPDVATYAVIGTKDNCIRPTWARAAYRRVLGVDPVELPTDHSPFLSAPADLAELLIGIASGEYPAGVGR